MLRFLIIVLFSMSAIISSMAQGVSSNIRELLSTQRLPDYHDSKYCSFTEYEKAETFLHDIDAFDPDGKFAKHKAWMRAIIDATGASDTLYISIMQDQRVSNVYWRNNPAKEVKEVMGINREGLDEIFNSDDFLDFIMAKNLKEYIIHGDTVIISGQKKMSPVGPDCWQYYNYEVMNSDDSLMTVKFEPKSDVLPKMSGFITLKNDGAWYIAQIKFCLESTGEEKQVGDIYYTQNFSTTPQGYTVLAQSDFQIDFRRLGIFGRVQYRNSKVYSNYSEDSIPDRKFRHKSKLKFNCKSDYRTHEFWEKYDKPLARQLLKWHVEDSLYLSTSILDSTGVRRKQSTMQAYLNAGLDYLGESRRGMKLLSTPLKALVNNYIELGNPPVFDITPAYSLISFNKIDKLRLRFGGMTTANLFKRFFLGGHIAYGFGSENLYYGAKALYSFVDKVYEPSEFPKRNISIESCYDICFLGERNNHIDHDNLFKSFQWGGSNNMMYYDMQKMEMEWDQNNGIGYLFSLKRERDIATNTLFFHSMNDFNGNAFTMSSPGSVTTTELRFELLYYPASKRYYKRKKEIPINSELPGIGLSHTIGVKMLGGNYSYHMTELKLDKEWFLGIFGIGRTELKLGGIWNSVPFPLLLAPPANVSYFGNDDAFSLVNPFGFANDKYMQLIMALETNGNIIGKIPFIKKLHWKEFISFRMLWGSLSDKNNPKLLQNFDSNILMPLPVGTTIMDSKIPYIEGAVGIHNIFHVLNVDYVYRFTYRDIYGATCSGIRVGIHFIF